MSRKSKKITKNSQHKIHFHLKWTSAFFVLYLLLSLVYSPEFLLSDMRGRFKALADSTVTVTGLVLAPPVKPILSVAAVCEGENIYALLNWADDINSQTFNVQRDSLPLVTGLGVSNFSDQNVIAGGVYSYTVTAIGQMGPGFAISDAVNIEMPTACDAPLPAPFVQIISFDNKPAKPWNLENESEKKRPIFSGTVNMPNAEIEILINSSQVINAHIQADINGYWTWTPPIDLADGEHSILITATDPLDPNRIATTKLYFVIEKYDSDDENANESQEDQHNSSSKSDKSKKSKPKINQTQKSIIAPFVPPVISNESPNDESFDFSINLDKKNVLQGDNLGATIKINNINEGYANKRAKLFYVIYDEKYNEILKFSEDIIISKGVYFSKNIPISKYLTRGRYYLEAQIATDENIFTQRKSFEVLDKPILNLGGGFVLTYPTLLNMMGSASLLLLLIVLLWLFLFSREYWLYLHAVKHITEKNLQKLGFFSSEKGKGVMK